MAQMLRDSDSSEKHLEAAWRHIRLCNLVRAAHPFAVAMQPSHDALEAAVLATKNAFRAEQARRDQVRLLGFEGADLLRDLSGSAETYDRANPTSPAHGVLFREGGFSHLLDSDDTASPATLDEIALRVRSLGAAHTLAERAATLEAKATEIRTAEGALGDAVRARSLCEAEEELGQAALRRQYEHNYLDTRKALGSVCERLFPKLSRTKKQKKE